MYRVRVNEVVATATGQSKKKAKHAAAKAVLEALLTEEGGFKEGFLSDGVLVNAENLNDIIAEATTAPPVDETSSKNPVGALQELCMKMRWQPPYYETEKATGLPHEKVFSIMCMVDNFQTSGEGKSKRLAKRQAADNMLIRLKALNIVTDDEEEAVKGPKKPEDDASYRSSMLYDRESDEDELIIDPQNVSLKDDTHTKMSYKAADSSEYAELKEEKFLNISSASHDRESDEDELIIDVQNVSLNDDMLMKMNSKATDSTEYTKLKEEKIKFEDLKIYDREDPTNGQTNLQKTYSKNVLKFLKDLKTSTSSYLQALQAIDIMDPQLDCPKLLQSIATEQNFEIIYIPIEQRGKNGECHCLLQITSLPVAVCFGSAMSKEEAIVSSARNALNFIQLMCKK
ncbi:RISC-loading complex subunit TARBP2 [Trichonephila clavata]|nr:RISC-loading complex subunit TARBP2 [Trichonephila clavata]